MAASRRFGIKHRTKINKKGGRPLSEEQKYVNTLNNRVRTLIDKGLISEDDAIATLGDIDGLELTRTGKISTKTVFSPEMKEILEQYISTPKNFINSKLYTAGRLLEYTKEDFYDIIGSDLVKDEINKLIAKYDGMLGEIDAEKILGIAEIRDLMSEFGSAFREGDITEARRLRSEIEKRLTAPKWGGGVVYD